MEAMNSASRHVLVVGADVSVLHGIAPMLRREEFEIHSVPASDLVLDLIQGMTFELLVVTYPSSDIALEDRLTAVRREGSGCRHAGLLLIAEPEQLDEAHAYVDRGANRAIGFDWADSRMWQAFADLLDVAPRVSLRIVVHLAIRVSDGKSIVECHTENLSRTGMLLSGAADLDHGARVEFIFPLPGQTTPVRGTAEVVRLAHQNGEKCFGVRFLSFRDDDKAILEEYLEAKAPQQPPE